MSATGFAIGVIIFVIYCAIKNNKSKTQQNTYILKQESQPYVEQEFVDLSNIPKLEQREWGLFLNLPYSCFNGHNYNDYNQGPHDGGLERAWGISSRYQLVHQLYWLITSGHTDDYYALRDRVAYANEFELNQIIQEIKNSNDSDEDQQEQLWRIEMMSKNINDIRNIKYIAWDFVRFSKLCLDGCRCGYITKQEAQEWSLMTASMIKRIYTGWEDFWNSFIHTRWLWAATDTSWAEDQQEFADKIQNILADDSYPTTQETWDMTLPELSIESFTRAVAGLGFSTDEGIPVTLEQLDARISYRLLPKQLDS